MFGGFRPIVIRSRGPLSLTSAVSFDRSAVATEALWWAALIRFFFREDRGRAIPTSAHTLGSAWRVRVVSWAARRQLHRLGDGTAGTSGPFGDVQALARHDARRQPSGQRLNVELCLL